MTCQISLPGRRYLLKSLPKRPFHQRLGQRLKEEFLAISQKLGAIGKLFTLPDVGKALTVINEKYAPFCAVLVSNTFLTSIKRPFSTIAFVQSKTTYK